MDVYTRRLPFAINKSAELVLFNCEAGIWDSCCRVGPVFQVCVEGLGNLDAVCMVVRLVACVDGWRDRIIFICKGG